ncbi:MAG TPA: hypothetical protein VMS02_05880, partial [Solirubrobacteraceae bacterium]|nr:hypothetical protein [Solirubrobacteraceae bacterium]
MTTISNPRRDALIAALVGVAVAVLPIASRAATAKKARLIASTGAAGHVLASSALLTGAVTPDGSETSYFFQWGTSTAYGAQTPTVKVGSGTSKVKVG